MSNVVYDKQFYEDRNLGSVNSAKGVFEHLFKYYKPKSIIDIGCGMGTWLTVAVEDYGIKDITGVDGHYVNREKLFIDKTLFVQADLEKVFSINRRYDMAMSLEVGEHLHINTSDNLIDTLTQASDFILFSAAIPGQGGTHHINEQYPEFWAEKFEQRGFVAIDFIREKIWNDKNIDVWYRQNIIIYIKKECLDKYHQDIITCYKDDNKNFLTRIHPEMFAYYSGKLKQVTSFEGFLRYKLYPLKKLLKKNKV